jgi:4-hydroxy-4-methyl-2-oxoglutarate aldolase
MMNSTNIELTGKIEPNRIKLFRLPSVDEQIIETLRQMSDLSGTVSDALDEMGISATVPASVLKPTIAGSTVVGQAVTLRNVIQSENSYLGASQRISRMAEIEAHNLARPGNVIVIEGGHDISNMGGISATIALRQGELGAIVDGGIRDVDQSRRIGFPIWSRSISSITGKWRLETVSVNDTIQIAGVQVQPGDVVVADDSGICFIPHAKLQPVYERVCQIAEGEARRYRDIEAGVSVPSLAKMTHVYRFTR